MSKQTTIREAQTKDIDILVRIIRQSFHDVAIRFSLTAENCPRHPSNCTKAWIETDLDRGVRYFILWEDDCAVGCVGIERPEKHVCFLERLSVIPERRQQGHGRSLVQYALEHPAIQGARKISIGIIAEQTELERWYGKFGFIEVQTRHFPHLPFQVKFMEAIKDNLIDP